MAGRRIERHERKHVWRRDVLILFVVIGLSLSAIAYAQFFYAPTVEKVLETPLTEGAGGTVAIPVIETNESEEAEIVDPDPDRDGWIGTYDRTKLLPYVNETEIRWYKEGEIRPMVQWDFGEIYTTFPVGCVFVNGERLCKGPLTENDIKPKNPIELLDGERRCSCLPASVTTCELFRIQGYTIKTVGAKRSTVSSVIISGHTWVEIEIDNKWFVIDNGWVFPLEEWIGNSIWIFDRNECLQCRY